MAKLPSKYAHVMSEDAPKLIKSARALLGTVEMPGAKNNPAILTWADKVQNVTKKKLGYTADSIPWCGLFVAYVCVTAGWTELIPARPLWARDWLTTGVKVTTPAFGDILVFGRQGGGHVGFYVGEDKDCYHVLGGNQSDAVTITRILKSRLLGARRPKWKVAQPASVKPILVQAGGSVSHNEA